MITIYNKALSDIKILAHINWGYIYAVKGIAKIMSVPSKVNIRAHSHETGQLLKEVTSSSVDGSYIIHLFTNELVDISAFVKENPNIRTNIYATITPYQVQDL